MAKAIVFLSNLPSYKYFYRVITAAGFAGAVLLVLLTPLQLPDPDDWANYLGVRNFSEGRFTVDGYTVYKQSREVANEGGILLQYLPLDKSMKEWALEKAPGYVFYLVPFHLAHIPRAGNIILMAGTVIVTYMLLRRMRDEKTAMTGSLLMMFTPIALVMLNRVYMDTYASLAFLVTGGGLYFYYHLDRDNLGSFKGGALLFIACFFAVYSVVTRYTNAPIVAVLGLHYVLSRFADWRRGRGTGLRVEILPVILGAGIPVAGFLLYNYYVFGSPWTYSYAISPYPIKFAFQYLGQEWGGESIPLQILRYNTEGYARNLFIGFPLLLIGVPAFIFVVYQKIVGMFRRNGAPGAWSSLRDELPWGMLLALAGWFACVFLLYWGYEWTAGIVKGGGAVIFTRFLLPGLFPAVIIAALVMARFPAWTLIPALVLLIAFGVMFYLQWAYSLPAANGLSDGKSSVHILPAWVTERTLESRWEGHGFAPWTEWEKLYGK